VDVRRTMLRRLEGLIGTRNQHRPRESVFEAIKECEREALSNIGLSPTAILYCNYKAVFAYHS